MHDEPDAQARIIVSRQTLQSADERR